MPVAVPAKKALARNSFNEGLPTSNQYLKLQSKNGAKGVRMKAYAGMCTSGGVR